MNEREAWQYIGEAYEKYAETGEHTHVPNVAHAITLSGLCGARTRLHIAGMLDTTVSWAMRTKIQRQLSDLMSRDVGNDGICLSPYGVDYAADRAMLCYLFAEFGEETENE